MMDGDIVHRGRLLAHQEGTFFTCDRHMTWKNALQTSSTATTVGATQRDVAPYRSDMQGVHHPSTITAHELSKNQHIMNMVFIAVVPFHMSKIAMKLVVTIRTVLIMDKTVLQRHTPRNHQKKPWWQSSPPPTCCGAPTSSVAAVDPRAAYRV